jgi:hypothetical protein
LHGSLDEDVCTKGLGIKDFELKEWTPGKLGPVLCLEEQENPKCLLQEKLGRLTERFGNRAHELKTSIIR